MIRIDHATLAARSLDPMVEALRGLGFGPTYGGAHSNGVTHMSLVSFPDGSYLELISTLEPGARSSPARRCLS